MNDDHDQSAPTRLARMVVDVDQAYDNRLQYIRQPHTSSAKPASPALFCVECTRDRLRQRDFHLIESADTFF